MSTGSAAARVFFAVMPDALAREQTQRAADLLSVAAPGHRVPPGDYHVTLAFLGAVPETRLSVLCDAGDALRAGRCTLRFDGVDHWSASQVIVAVAGTIPVALQTLWQQLRDGLASRGWAPEPRPFRPHVTLARKVAQGAVLPALSFVEWSVDTVYLMRSDTGGARSSYTVVGTWPLLYDAVKHGKTP